MLRVIPFENFCAELVADFDKSITIRAILLGAISKGETVVKNPLIAEDTKFAIECARRMGATVSKKRGELSIVGCEKIADGKTFYCGNSGTLARLLTGLLSGAGVSAKITGDGSLSKRPMGRIIQPLTARGANVTSKNGCLPLVVKPAKLDEFCYEMPIDSAQVKSAILLSGVTSGAFTQIVERNKTRNHTERMLEYFGAKIAVNDRVIELFGSSLTAKKLTVPQDPSSASCYLAMGLLRGEVTVRGVLFDSLRMAYIDKLKSLGADIEVSNVKSDDCFYSCDLTARKSKLTKMCIDGAEVPALIDEIPCLAVLSCFNDGAQIVGAGELKVKESDRLKGITDLVTKLGASVVERADGLTILPVKQAKEFEFFSDDHRMIMCAHLAMKCGVGGTILGEEAVAVSFKNYFKNLQKNALAVVGRDVKASRSPIVHKHILSGFGVQNFSYQTRSVKEEEFADFIKKCPYKAINVTIPYKSEALKLVKSVDPLATKSQSLNFVYKNKGYSFDGLGLCLAMQEIVDLKGKTALVYGIGGAGKSIAVALLKMGAKVYLKNRTESVANEFLKSFGGRQEIGLYDGERCDILINATPVVNQSVFEYEQISGAQLIVDINYGKKMALKELSAKFGKSFLDGMAMLFYQAYYADCVIAGQKFNKESAKKCFEDFKVKYENSCS